MNYKKGLVSIIMPTYNRKYIIGDAIDSCLSQTYRNIEIIVCDDHSTDGTKEYIAERMREDARIRYCMNPEGKKGANAARNTAIKMAQGEYLAFLDTDDYLLEDAVACRVEVFHNNHDVAMVYGNNYTEVGNRRYKRIYTDIRKEKLSQKRYLMQELALCLQSTIMLRTSVFQKIGLLDEEQKAWTDDGLVVAVGMRYPLMHSGKYIVVMRKSEVSMTSNKWNMYFGCKIMVERYKRQILHYASLGRYLVWKIRLFSMFCYAKEVDADKIGNEWGKIFWKALHISTKKIVFPFFRLYCE